MSMQSCPCTRTKYNSKGTNVNIETNKITFLKHKQENIIASSSTSATVSWRKRKKKEKHVLSKGNTTGKRICYLTSKKD